MRMFHILCPVKEGAPELPGNLTLSGRNYEEVCSNYYADHAPSGDMTIETMYYDIETTGLSPKSAYCFIIGCLWFSCGRWHMRQWFAEKPADEGTMLQQFLTLALSAGQLVQFNGTTFDFPFLEKRAALYDLDYRPLANSQRDQFARIRRMKSLLPLPNLKLQTLEEFCGYKRRDVSDGKEVIAGYKAFLQTGDSELLTGLMLHNYDDIAGMPCIEDLCRIQELLQGGLWPCTLSQEDDSCHQPVVDCVKVRARFTADADLRGTWILNNTLERLTAQRAGLEIPVTSSADAKEYFLSLTISRTELVLWLPCRRDKLKYFYKDYRNYFYLPEEGKAVHKSVGIYVDPGHREKATKETACLSREDLFLRQPGDILTPAFRKSVQDKDSYCTAEDFRQASEEDRKRFINEILKKIKARPVH